MADDLGFSPQQTEAPQEDLGFLAHEPDTSNMRAYVNDNLKIAAQEKAASSAVPQQKTEAKDWLDAVESGWGFSVTGLMAAGHEPDVIVPENAGLVMKAASQIGTLAGDIPAMIAGGYVGKVVGGAVGGAITKSVPGMALGAVVGGDFGAFALPQALRKIMMDHYEKGDIQSPEEFFSRLTSTTWEALKGGSVGVVTGGAGRLVGPAAIGISGKVAGTAAKTLAELSTMVTASAAVEGHLPKMEDFATGAIVLAGFSGSLAVAGKMRGMYTATGESPAAMVERIQKDPVLKQQTLSVDPDLPLKVTPEPTAEEKIPVPAAGAPKEWAARASDLYSKFKDFTYENVGKRFEKANDDKASIKFIEQKLVGPGELLPADESPYIGLRNFRATRSIVEHFFNFGTVDFKTSQKNGEGLHDIFKDLPKRDGEEYTPSEQKIIDVMPKELTDSHGPTWGKLATFLIAKRLIEKSGQGLKFPIDEETAKTVVADGESQYGKTAKRLVDYNNRVLDFAVAAGLEDQQSAKDMKAKNLDYSSPLPRAERTTKDGKTTYGEFKTDPFQPVHEMAGANSFKEMEGSAEHGFMDPVDAIFAKTERLVSQAELNRVKQNLVDLQTKSTTGETIIKEDVGNKLPGKNQFAVKVDGQTKVFTIREDLADAAKALNYSPSQLNLVQKIAQIPTKLLRAGTALSPEFVFNNAFKDPLTAAVVSKYPHIPFADMISGLGHIFGKSEEFQRFLLSGGVSGGIAEMTNLIGQDYRKLDLQTGFLDRAQNYIKTPFEYLEYLSAALENTPRFNEARRAGALVAGAARSKLIEGGFNARNVTVDFDKAGPAMRVWSQYDPFVNAALQGTETELKALYENPSRAHKMAIAAITIPSVVTWIRNRDDSRVNDRPNQEKNMYWYLTTNSWGPAANKDDFSSRPDDLKRIGKDGQLEVNNGIVFKLKKPYLLGLLYGSLVERTLDAFYQKNPGAFKDFDTNMFKALFPDNVGAVSPTALTPVIESMSNHSFFRDRPIVNAQAERQLPPDMYNEYTSETAKQVGKIIGTIPFLRKVGSEAAPLEAPLVVDNYVYSWTGQLGKTVVQMTDGVLHAAGIGDQTPRHAWAWGEVPVIRALVTKYPDRDSQPLRDFYERSRLANQALASATTAANTGNGARLKEILAEYDGKMYDTKSLTQAIAQANKALDNIDRAPEQGPDGKHYGPKDKLQMMQTIYYQMTEMAKAGNKALDAAEAASKKAAGGN